MAQVPREILINISHLGELKKNQVQQAGEFERRASKAKKKEKKLTVNLIGVPETVCSWLVDFKRFHVTINFVVTSRESAKIVYVSRTLKKI